jgi:predicted metal-dependent TIM-barrel fold hydrolase
VFITKVSENAPQDWHADSHEFRNVEELIRRADHQDVLDIIETYIWNRHDATHAAMEICDECDLDAEQICDHHGSVLWELETVAEKVREWRDGEEDD